MITVRQLFDLPASQSSKFHMTAHVCRGAGMETVAMDELLDTFSQVFARLSAGTAQVVGALPGCGLFAVHSAFW